MKHRVIVWGTGFVGKMVLRELIPHPDFELVGLIVQSPDKVGKDAGEIAGLGTTTGVRASGFAMSLIASIWRMSALAK